MPSPARVRQRQKCRDVQFPGPLVLARAQFGLNIAFHILFPTISMSLAWFLVFFRWRHFRTGDALWLDAYRQWVKIFAPTFAIGVVPGIVMSFQFGTNWPGPMGKVGNIAVPLLGYDVMTAFFVEATFPGVMLFGMHRVPGWMHLLAASLVAGGQLSVGSQGDPRGGAGGAAIHHRLHGFFLPCVLGQGARVDLRLTGRPGGPAPFRTTSTLGLAGGYRAVRMSGCCNAA